MQNILLPYDLFKDNAFIFARGKGWDVKEHSIIDYWWNIGDSELKESLLLVQRFCLHIQIFVLGIGRFNIEIG